VNAVNDVPTISDIADQSTNEDTATGAIAFTVGDQETTAGSLTVSGSSSNTALVPNANIAFGGSGANRTVTLTPAANQNGTATITVTVNDGTTTTSDTFVLTVNAVNDAPVNTVPGAQTTNEDTSIVFSTANGNLISVSDVDASALEVELTATSTLTLSQTTGLTFSVGDGTADANMKFTGSITNINSALEGMVYAPTANASVAGSVTITSNDQGNTGSGGAKTDTDIVGITINAVNDAPTISDVANQSTNEDTATGAIPITVGDLETAAGSLTMSGSSSNTILVPNGNIVFGGSGADRTVTLTPAANQNGTATITVTVSDGTATTSDTFVLTVNNVDNDPPVHQVPSAQTTAEDTVLVFNSANNNLIQVSDPDVGSGNFKTMLYAQYQNSISWWPLDNNYRDVISGHDGTAGGNATFTASGRIDQGVTLDGTGDIIRVTNTADLNFGAIGSRYAIAVWVKTSGNPDEFSDGIIGKAATNANTPQPGELAIATNNRPFFFVNTSSAGHQVFGSSSIADNQWHHLVGVRDNNTVSLYVDGALAQSITYASIGDARTTADWVFGSYSGAANIGANEQLAGSIDDVLMIKDNILTAQQIREIYQAGIVSKAGSGQMQLASTTGLTFTIGDSNNPYMEFTGTQTNVNAALDGITYTPNPDANGTHVLTLNTNDQGNTGTGGAKTDTDTVTITANAVNDAPVNSVPGAQSVNEDTVLEFKTANSNAITISDIDAGSSDVKVTLSVNSGTLTITDTTGLTFTTGDGTSDATMTFAGSISTINTRTLQYQGNANFVGTDTLTITTDDQGNTGSGGAKTDTDTVAITVNAVNDPPVHQVPGAQTTPEDTALVFNSANNNLIQVSDPDIGSGNFKTMLYTQYQNSISWWPLDNNYRDVISGHNGTAEGNTTFTASGRIDQAVTLDGTNDQIRIAHHEDLNFGAAGSQYAISLWARNTGVADNWNPDEFSDAFIGKATNGFSNIPQPGELAITTAEQPLFAVNVLSTETYSVTSPTAILDSAWHNFVGMRNNNTLSLYVDGVLVASQTFASIGDARTNSDWIIGSYTGDVVTGANEDPLADIDDVLMMKDNIFTAQQIQEIYQAGIVGKAGSGQIQLASTTGLTFNIGDSNNAYMEFTGTSANVNTALNGMSYTPNPDSRGTQVLTLITSDQGNTGTGGVKTDTDLVTISVTPQSIGLDTLTGDNGFVINGVTAGDNSGEAVGMTLADINGDGVDDLLLGALQADRAANTNIGEAYVVFGSSTGFSSSLELSALSGTNGFKLTGMSATDWTGDSITSADVNGDGFAEVIVGAPQTTTNPGGKVFMVYGQASFSASVDLSTLNGTNGVRFDGISAGSNLGGSLGFSSSRVDVNGDGLEDMFLGAPGGDPSAETKGNAAGQAFVVFGKTSAYTHPFDISTLNGTNGFTVNGASGSDVLGKVSSGDINGDGFGDLIVGADGRDVGANTDAGTVYVIYGKASGFASSIDLAGAFDGFRVEGLSTGDRIGMSVASADINRDGFDDLIIGGPKVDVGANGDAGKVYVIMGSGSLGTSVDLSALNGANGFVVTGKTTNDEAGFSVSRVGDFNADGFDDFFIGAWQADPDSKADAGEGYVIYGKSGAYSATLSLSTFSATDGFTVRGGTAGDLAGSSVSGGGDVNGDGFADLIIGAPGGDPGGRSAAGKSYVVFGSNTTGSVTQSGTSGADTLTGTSGVDKMVGKQGNDILDGQGGADVLYGGLGSDTIKIGDVNFLRIDGGGGDDTLTLNGSGLTLNLTTMVNNKIAGIENIDINGTGNNTLTLNVRDVLDLSDTSNQLIVKGAAGDAVNATGGWVLGGTQSIGGEVYNSYTSGNATLLIDQDISAIIS
ncbi:MAG: FG-GAP repeat protein, partial [Gammaproteobacteria bacterium]|nr:FG-GAP repeat protein [Gammaproteobacteria bacterium]